MRITEKKYSYTGKVLALFIVLAFASFNALRAEQQPGKMKPFRVLLIIGDQWEDPASYMVDMSKPTGEYSGYDATPEVQGNNDFHHLAVLLKSWAIPFDIVRLDQQILDRYLFLDMYNNLKYGTIIWDVNKSDKLLNQDYSIISELVKESGVGLIAISDRVSQTEIQSVLGIKYIGSWESNSQLISKDDHFITRGLSSPFQIDSGTIAHMQRQQVELLDGTTAIVEQGSYPQVTIKENPSGSHMVWIGNDHNYLFYFQDMRTLLRRAITWTIGYNIYKTWDNDIIMIMDDPGGASNTWLEHWHYPVLSEEIIEKYLINPLLKQKAVLNINFVPAFVNEGKKRMEPAWNQSYTDKFGTKQDYISSKKGYDKGVKLGVFEVLCHGLTHMQPDLVSDPGWYGAPIDKEKSEVGWYREFGDVRRKKEIPPAEQLWRMKTAKDVVEQNNLVLLRFSFVPADWAPQSHISAIPESWQGRPDMAGMAGNTAILGKIWLLPDGSSLAPMNLR